MQAVREREAVSDTCQEFGEAIRFAPHCTGCLDEEIPATIQQPAILEADAPQRGIHAVARRGARFVRRAIFAQGGGPFRSFQPESGEVARMHGLARIAGAGVMDVEGNAEREMGLRAVDVAIRKAHMRDAGAQHHATDIPAHTQVWAQHESAALRRRSAAATADEKPAVDHPSRGKTPARAQREASGEKAAALTVHRAKTGCADIPVRMHVDEIMHTREPHRFGR